MKIKKFRHIALIVKDMNSIIEFYVNTFGCIVKRDFEINSEEFQKGIGIENASARCVHLVIPDSEVEIELFQFYKPHNSEIRKQEINDSGIRHFAIVIENMKDAIVELKSKGILIHSDPIRFEKPKEIKGFCFVYIKDPEGNIIELNELPENA